jgi:integrase
LRVLDEEQSRLLLAAARRRWKPGDYVSHRDYVLFLTAMTTGLRSAEIAGLRRQDVSLTLGEAMVTQTFYRVPPKRWVFKPPKSASGRRAVPLPPVLVEELQALFGEQDYLRDELGPAYNDLKEHGPLVFSQPTGAPLFMHNVVRRTLKALLTDAKLPAVRLHDLRHGFATLHGLQGTPVRVLQELMGHSSPGFTLATYQHVLRGQKEEANARLSTRLVGQAVAASTESSAETVSTARETPGTTEKEGT